jgi:hypothetical protein
MAANGSSANTANIITALGNAFKDPSGAALANDRLAAVLIQNMNQLNDLAKQGKLNQQQIMQVRHDPIQFIHIINWDPFRCFFTSYAIMQTSTSPRRQSRCVDQPGSQALPPIHILTTSPYLSAWPPPTNPLARTHPPPHVYPFGSEDGDGKLDSHAGRERDREGRLSDQHDAEPYQHDACRVAVGGGTTYTHGRHVDGSCGRCVVVLSLSSRTQAKSRTTTTTVCSVDVLVR